MLKKTIAYTDFNGVDRTEDFYFNLSKAEIGEWELRAHVYGGIEKQMRTAIETEDGEALMDFFRELIGKSYGVKSEDGRFFRKSAELREDFFSSPAYDQLFMELVTEPNNAVVFFNEVFPADLRGGNTPLPQPTGPRQPQDYRQKELPTHNVFENNEQGLPKAMTPEEQAQFEAWQAEQQRQASLNWRAQNPEQ